ncbi:MAG: hypothetical protein ACRDRX_24380 [Pseudonocardiaceae bacterium]
MSPKTTISVDARGRHHGSELRTVGQCRALPVDARQTQEHMKEIMTIADKASPRLYTMRAVHHPAQEMA